MQFRSLGLVDPILRAVEAEGYKAATPIQAQTIPPILEGRDLIGCAQTGTGKTAAFALPTLQRLCGDRPRTKSSGKSDRGRAEGDRGGKGRRPVRALILSPTRELAVQIGQSLAVYGRFTDSRHVVVYGGVSQVPQVRSLQRGVDILVATPGRVLDLMNQGHVDVSEVEILIFDEADRMLDMGFIHDLRRIAADVPSKRQTLMFSATMPEAIRQVAAEWLRDPVHVQAAESIATADQIKQSVYFVEPKQKPLLLSDFLHGNAGSRTLVFSRTKHGADKIVRQLSRVGIQAAAIHGNKTQATRQRVLDQFKSDRLPVLVATDVAARGLDVDDISHVINYDMPHDPETYVHRIGRTGRAGASGIAVSFCGRDEQSQLRSIERLLLRPIAVEGELPEYYRAAKARATSDAVRPAKKPRLASKPGRAAKPDRPAKLEHATKPRGAAKPGRPAKLEHAAKPGRSTKPSGAPKPCSVPKPRREPAAPPVEETAERSLGESVATVASDSAPRETRRQRLRAKARRLAQTGRRKPKSSRRTRAKNA